MFRATLKSAATLKKIFASIDGLLEEANLECTENGMFLKCLDSARVTFISLTLEINAFESYDCPRPLVMGIKFESMKTTLNCAYNDDSITLESTYEADYLTMKFFDEAGERTSEYQMMLMNIEAEPLEVPDPPFDNVVTLQSDTFKKTISDLFKFGAECIFDVNEGSITFSAEGQTGRGKVTFTNKENKTSILCKAPTKSTYGMRYLSNYAKAEIVSPVVELGISADLPLRVTFKQIGAISLVFYLAPKLIED